ncbi:MAG: hypothetical protein R2839_09915 [Thermomicrobiales bacterium]
MCRHRKGCRSLTGGFRGSSAGIGWPCHFRVVAVDAALLWFAFWLAYELRYGFEIGGDVFPWDQQAFSAYYQRSALFVLFSSGDSDRAGSLSPASLDDVARRRGCWSLVRSP